VCAIKLVLLRWRIFFPAHIFVIVCPWLSTVKFPWCEIFFDLSYLPPNFFPCLYSHQWSYGFGEMLLARPRYMKEVMPPHVGAKYNFECFEKGAATTSLLCPMYFLFGEGWKYFS